MLVVGFGYKANSGKDSAVKAIMDAFPDLDIRRYAFGDMLKEEIAGREFELCMKYGLKFEPDNKHRQLLQYYGTEVVRKRDPFYWVRKLAEKLNKERPQVALISDLRFNNECALVKQFGGYTIKIVREGYIDLSLNSTHLSESELDDYVFDITITVDADNLKALQDSAVEAFTFILNNIQMPVFEDEQ